MAPVQSSPRLPLEHMTSKKTSSPYHSQPGPDMVQLKQVVKIVRKGYSLSEPPVVNEPSGPSQSCFSSDERTENAQAVDENDSLQCSYNCHIIPKSSQVRRSGSHKSRVVLMHMNKERTSPRNI
ncbi:uncharacterized protein N7479_001710 [Penicillium vulpinum]|uniref:uncharacterized protein n=1 Tax=Penicillium vulpinum TaxID=29845 RepID=UPI0025489D46|nr:uncharacterized protein N7479_001710 [Penicillium vulpinum]KAJ5971792.1 hypothetical protein N7479_001710 [Penicillium vulpinum]